MNSTCERFCISNKTEQVHAYKQRHEVKNLILSERNDEAQKTRTVNKHGNMQMKNGKNTYFWIGLHMDELNRTHITPSFQYTNSSISTRIN